MECGLDVEHNCESSEICVALPEAGFICVPSEYEESSAWQGGKIREPYMLCFHFMRLLFCLI